MLFSKIRIICIISCILLTSFASSSLHAFSLEDEMKLGKDINAEILKKTPVSKNKQSIKEIEELGQKISQNVNRKQIPYHFTILQDNDLNAFAVPGGYVYFTQRLWDVLRYDERAGVLAHETVHVDQRHSLDALLKHQRRRIWTGVLLYVFGAGNWAYNAADIVNTLHEYKYSRGDEKQADQGGVKLLEKANLNPAGLLLSLRKIKRLKMNPAAANQKYSCPIHQQRKGLIILLNY